LLDRNGFQVICSTGFKRGATAKTIIGTPPLLFPECRGITDTTNAPKINRNRIGMAGRTAGQTATIISLTGIVAIVLSPGLLPPNHSPPGQFAIASDLEGVNAPAGGP